MLEAALVGTGEGMGEFELKLQFAALKDVGELLIKATYALEGDRLEILVAYRRIEQVRSFGKALKQLMSSIQCFLGSNGGSDSVSTPLPNINRALLPTVAKLVRDNMKTQKGLCVSKVYDGVAYVGVLQDDGELSDPNEKGEREVYYKVKYCVDDDQEDMTADEVKEHYLEFTDELYVTYLKALIPAFDYVEDRLTGECAQANFSCA